MNFKELNIFVTVAEQRSFTKASEVLFIAQPSLSKAVQKLEEELDVTLLDRSNRNLKLTEAGKVLYQKSKEALSAVESIPIAIAELSEVVTGHLKIGLSPIIGMLFFPKIAEKYNKRFPKVTLDFLEEGSLVIGKQVERGELDIGFVVLPTESDYIQSKSIYKDEFVLCVSSQHALSHATSISLNSLRDEQFILFVKGWALHGVVTQACKGAGFTPSISYESAQWDLVLELVSVNLGITVIPRILAHKLSGIDIVSIPIVNPSIQWNIGIVTNNKSYQSLALKEFVKIVDEVYGEKFK
jgi:DNA-binding transcriptional LysR family regulator